MDAVQQVLYSGAKAIEFAGRLVVRLASAGEWTALLVLLLSCYALYFMTARLARTALWIVKWTVILFMVFAAVGWADSSWTGKRPAGSRGVDWWSREGNKGVPSGTFPGAWNAAISDATMPRRPKQDDTAVTWAKFAKSASGIYARHSFNAMYAYAERGLGALDAWSADGISRVGQTVLEQMPPESRKKLEKEAKKARKKRW